MHKMVKYIFLYIILVNICACSGYNEATSQSTDSQFAAEEESQIKQKYLLALIGEEPIEEALADKLLVYISRPYGKSDIVISVTRFSNATIVCKKQIIGIGLSRSYSENCESFEPRVMDSLWLSAVKDIKGRHTNFQNELIPNDGVIASVNLNELEGVIKLDVELCAEETWPLHILNDFVTDNRIEITLPDC